MKDVDWKAAVAAINAPPDVHKMMTLPPRKVRRKKRKPTLGTINAFARPIRKHQQPPASIETLVAIHIKDVNGKVIRKMVVPRENVDPDMLAKRRSEEKKEDVV